MVQYALSSRWSTAKSLVECTVGTRTPFHFPYADSPQRDREGVTGGRGGGGGRRRGRKRRRKCRKQKFRDYFIEADGCRWGRNKTYTELKIYGKTRCWCSQVEEAVQHDQVSRRGEGHLHREEDEAENHPVIRGFFKKKNCTKHSISLIFLLPASCATMAASTKRRWRSSRSAAGCTTSV